MFNILSALKSTHIDNGAPRRDAAEQAAIVKMLARHDAPDAAYRVATDVKPDAAMLLARRRGLKKTGAVKRHEAKARERITLTHGAYHSERHADKFAYARTRLAAADPLVGPPVLTLTEKIRPTTFNDPEKLAQAVYSRVVSFVREPHSSQFNKDLVLDAQLKTENDWGRDVEALFRRDLFPPLSSHALGQHVRQLAAALKKAVENDESHHLYAQADRMTFNGEVFQKRDKLGEGASSAVFRYASLESGKTVAVRSARYSTALTPEQDKQLRAQIRLHRYAMGDQAARTNRVLRLEGVVTDQSGQLHVVMEDAKGGDVRRLYGLLHYLEVANLIGFSAARAIERSLAAQATQSANDIHQLKITHGDFKPANMLLDKHGFMKAGDFEMATPSRATPPSSDESIPDVGDPKRDIWCLGHFTPSRGLTLDTHGNLAPRAENIAASGRFAEKTKEHNGKPAQIPTAKGLLQGSYLNTDDIDLREVDTVVKSLIAFANRIPDVDRRAIDEFESFGGFQKFIYNDNLSPRLNEANKRATAATNAQKREAMDQVKRWSDATGLTRLLQEKRYKLDVVQTR